MEEELTALYKLKEQGYVEIEHFGYVIVAKKKDTGKYYLISSCDLIPMQGSESDQIKLIDKSTVYLVQDGSLNVISLPVDFASQNAKKDVVNEDLSVRHPSPFEVEAIPRPMMHVFFIVGTSDSMRGAKIGSVNCAISETIQEISQICEANVNIKVSVLSYSDGSKWMYNEPKDADGFEWKDLEASGGRDLGNACITLEKVLNRNDGWMGMPTGSCAPVLYAPVFILLSDGGATDDYRYGLNKLWKNGWFKLGLKVAISIGDDADIDILTVFTGNREGVLSVHEINSLGQIIRQFIIRKRDPEADVTFEADEDGFSSNEQLIVAGISEIDAPLADVDGEWSEW